MLFKLLNRFSLYLRVYIIIVYTYSKEQAVFWQLRLYTFECRANDTTIARSLSSLLIFTCGNFHTQYNNNTSYTFKIASKIYFIINPSLNQVKKNRIISFQLHWKNPFNSGNLFENEKRK